MVLCESGLGAHVWAPWCDPEALCLRVSSGDVSLLHSTSHLTLNTSHHQCTVTILYLIPQFSHSLCLVNVHFPQVKKVLRTMAQGLDPPMVKRQTDNVGVFPV